MKEFQPKSVVIEKNTQVEFLYILIKGSVFLSQSVFNKMNQNVLSKQYQGFENIQKLKKIKLCSTNIFGRFVNKNFPFQIETQQKSAQFILIPIQFFKSKIEHTTLQKLAQKLENFIEFHKKQMNPLKGLFRLQTSKTKIRSNKISHQKMKSKANKFFRPIKNKMSFQINNKNKNAYLPQADDILRYQQFKQKLYKPQMLKGPNLKLIRYSNQNLKDFINETKKFPVQIIQQRLLSKRKYLLNQLILHIQQYQEENKI